MLGNKHHSGFGSSSGPKLDLTASNREELGDDHSVNAEVTPPPLGVKLTAYKLFFMATVFCIGTAKTILTYKGQSTSPTILDWVAGTLLTILLYWFGLYDERDINTWKWFYQVDYAPAIGYFAKCVAGSAMWLPFDSGNLLIFCSLILSLVPWAALALTRYRIPPVFGPVVAVGFSIFLCVVLPWLGLSRFNLRRAQRLRGWESGVDFVNIYGPEAPPKVGHRWSGVVGTIVGLLCGGALILLPFGVSYFLVFYFLDRLLI